VPPDQFVPLLEESSQIVAVGQWALEQALRDHAHWKASGLPAVPVAVNVSAVQLRHRDFVEQVGRVLDSADERGWLEIEMTETMLMGDIDENVVRLRALRDRGVAIAIDDFGTGYSSLAYLARLPINTIKIDRAFVKDMDASAETMTVVSTIISLARSLSLKVVAEGVETAEQLKFLRLLHCDQMQGWLFSKALPADAFADLLREGRRLTGRAGEPAR
jgi:EAL domain-containing protein (putative c-di-GMP-specific phosphodiesterase class I)